MPKEYVAIGLLALSGFLLGGVYSTWKTAKAVAILLIVFALVAVGGAVAWIV